MDYSIANKTACRNSLRLLGEVAEYPLLAELRRSGPGCGVSPLASEADHSRRARKCPLCARRRRWLDGAFRMVPNVDTYAVLARLTHHLDPDL